MTIAWPVMQLMAELEHIADNSETAYWWPT